MKNKRKTKRQNFHRHVGFEIEKNSFLADIMGKNKCNSNVKKASETATRMNFLYQAAHTVMEDTTPKNSTTKSKNEKSNQIVAAYYTQLMVGIGQKSVLKCSKELKRTICKGCRGLLVPGKTATVVVKNKQKKIGSLCSICQTEKLFPLNHVSKNKKK